MKRVLLILIVTGLLAGCKTGKPYVRPDLDIPTAFRNGDAMRQDTSDMILAWKSFFEDRNLQHLIDTVLEHNHDMITALNNIRLNEAYLKQAKVAWQPAFAAGLGAGTNYFSDNSMNGAAAFDLDRKMGIRNIDDYTISAGVSWELDLWGKINMQRKEALNIWLQHKEARKTVQTRLIAETATAYYALLMLHQQIAIARNNLVLSDSTIRIIRVQLEQGAATSLALQQAEVQRKTIQSIIPDLQAARTVQENSLRLLTAQYSTKVAVNTGTPAFHLPQKIRAGVPIALLAHRPDIRAKEYEVQAAHQRLGIAKASLYPTLSISAAGGLNSFQASNWINIPASLFGNLAGNLTQPLFARRKLKTGVLVSRIGYEQKVNEFRKTVFLAVTEVSDELVKSEQLSEKITIAEDAGSLLLRAVADADLLFRNGMADYLEVIAVQQNLLQNQLNLAYLRKEQAAANIRLFRALGGGVDL